MVPTEQSFDRSSEESRDSEIKAELQGRIRSKAELKLRRAKTE